MTGISFLTTFGHGKFSRMIRHGIVPFKSFGAPGTNDVQKLGPKFGPGEIVNEKVDGVVG